MRNYIPKILFVLILVLALGLRFYKLDSVPPSISWDEAAVGYNAWTVANYGKDEYGKLFPLYFRSFGDDKHPVHIYLTAISVKLLGLNEFSTRLPSAVLGTLNVILIYFLAKILFEKELIGLSAAFLLAISPQNIHFSRFNHEANFVVFFLLLALFLFFYSVKKHKKILVCSTLSFTVCFLTYHPAKVIVPLIVVLLFVMYWKEILKDRADFILSIIVVIILAVTILLNPQLLGIARINQTSLNKEAVEKTRLYQVTKNEFLGRINLTATQYSWHFLPKYLFLSGDDNPKLSPQVSGEFYKIEALLLILGVIYLILKILKRDRKSILLLSLALIAPLPSSLAAEAPHAGRASFMMGSWNLISAVGFYFIINIVKYNFFKIAVSILIISILLFSLLGYLSYYFGEYVKRYAIEWQYGMKQIVEYVGNKENQDKYEQVYMSEVRSQPYVFFLYYLKTPLPNYLSAVVYNNSESKSYNTVSSFDKYYFGGWDKVESFPNKGILYILTPSEYDGLRLKLKFEVKKLIKYPNGTAAFYMVSAN